MITEDIERQKQQPAQRPLSDVYLQGMPPKRRKVIIEPAENRNKYDARVLFLKLDSGYLKSDKNIIRQADTL